MNTQHNLMQVIVYPETNEVEVKEPVDPLSLIDKNTIKSVLHSIVRHPRNTNERILRRLLNRIYQYNEDFDSVDNIHVYLKEGFEARAIPYNHNVAKLCIEVLEENCNFMCFRQHLDPETLNYARWQYQKMIDDPAYDRISFKDKIRLAEYIAETIVQQKRTIIISEAERNEHVTEKLNLILSNIQKESEDFVTMIEDVINDFFTDPSQRLIELMDIIYDNHDIQVERHRIICELAKEIFILYQKVENL
jgi:hypothetical protein